MVSKMRWWRWKQGWHWIYLRVMETNNEFMRLPSSIEGRTTNADPFKKSWLKEVPKSQANINVILCTKIDIAGDKSENSEEPEGLWETIPFLGRFIARTNSARRIHSGKELMVQYRILRPLQGIWYSHTLAVNERLQKDTNQRGLYDATSISVDTWCVYQKIRDRIESARKIGFKTGGSFIPNPIPGIYINHLPSFLSR